MSDEIKLERCPCGAPPYADDYGPGERLRYFVRCDEDGSIGEGCGMCGPGCADSAEAALAWNRMALAAEIERELMTALLIIETANDGAFCNGNAAPGGTPDEGEVLTHRWCESARALLARVQPETVYPHRVTEERIVHSEHARRHFHIKPEPEEER